MPCRNDYLEPNQREVESRKVLELLKEVGLNRSEIPYYGHPTFLDNDTRILCDFCQHNDVTQYSLELQIWWRDHQKADKARLEREMREHDADKAREAALAKLTDYERQLLGV